MLQTKNLSAFQQLLLLFVLIVFSWFITSIIGTTIGILIWDYETVSNFDIALMQPQYLKYIQTIQSIGFFIIPPIIFTHLCGFRTTQWLHFQTPKLLLITFSIIAVIIIQPFISFSGVFNAKLQLPDSLIYFEDWMKLKEEQARQTTITFLNSTHWTQDIINIVIIVIIPALGEELLFRGSLQKILSSIIKNNHIPILITAFLFSALHMQFFGFLPRFILGVLFGYLFLYGKNIWLPIVAHFCNNLTAYIYYQVSLTKTSDTSSTLIANKEYPNIFLVGLSITGVILLLAYFRRQTKIMIPTAP